MFVWEWGKVCRSGAVKLARQKAGFAEITRLLSTVAKHSLPAAFEQGESVKLRNLFDEIVKSLYLIKKGTAIAVLFELCPKSYRF